MSDYKIQFKIDGQVVTEEQIHDVELSRYHKVFKEFGEKQIPTDKNTKWKMPWKCPLKKQRNS
ncbi:hypothetical protein R55210_AODCCCNP_00435 [Fructobacillus fructosus]|uniref:hypothetical protein n=1 Tax=Fructobacillus fructosus TaxID=1631 RepID=UPI002D9B572A|nr:hypothetical protein R55210_AODCCCNP_00435 [Fructobacillus fructosus]